MIGAYFDSSVYIRLILNEANPLQEWETIQFGVASTLLRVECLRGVERVWRNGWLTDSEYEAARLKAHEMFRHLQFTAVDETVTAIAEQPYPTFVASLDAIHLATAVAYRRSQPSDERPIIFATHDKQLAKAAAAMQFEVIGAEH